jgi:hypothetical protein
MEPGLTIRAVHPDEDYLGIEVAASIVARFGAPNPECAEIRSFPRLLERNPHVTHPNSRIIAEPP